MCLPVKQVAAIAGFQHVQYMTTVFRQHLGRTPGEHRRYSTIERITRRALRW